MTAKNTILRKINFYIILCVLIITNISLPQNTNVAFVKKAINDVKRKPASGETHRAANNTILDAEDQLLTGKKSFALVKFVDDISIIRVRELSTLIIKSEGSRNSTSKETFMETGGVGFEIKKQDNDKQFRLTSPTSVASIRGTKGYWSHGEHTDTLIVLEGLVNLRNRLSNREVNVGAGFIGFSEDDGAVFSREATREELELAEKYASYEDSQNEIDLEMKDKSGKSKTLKLRYKE